MNVLEKLLTKQPEEPVKRIAERYLLLQNKTEEEVADLIGCTTKTLENYLNGFQFDIEKETSSKKAEHLFIVAETYYSHDMEQEFSDLSKQLRRTMQRAKSINDLIEDAKEGEYLLDQTRNKEDWGLYHSVAHAYKTAWIVSLWKNSKNKNDKYTISMENMSKLVKAKNYWEKSLSFAKGRPKYFIEANLISTKFILKVFGSKGSSTGQYHCNPEPKVNENAEYIFYKKFVESASALQSISIWRNAIEMAIYLNKKHLIEEALNGFFECFMNMKTLDKKVALYLLQGIDSSDVISKMPEYQFFTSN